MNDKIDAKINEWLSATPFVSRRAFLHRAGGFLLKAATVAALTKFLPSFGQFSQITCRNGSPSSNGTMFQAKYCGQVGYVCTPDGCCENNHAYQGGSWTQCCPVVDGLIGGSYQKWNYVDYCVYNGDSTPTQCRGEYKNSGYNEFSWCGAYPYVCTVAVAVGGPRSTYEACMMGSP